MSIEDAVQVLLTGCEDRPAVERALVVKYLSKVAEGYDYATMLLIKDIAKDIEDRAHVFYGAALEVRAREKLS